MSPILKNSVHEMSPFENVHEKSPILKNSVHEMSLSTKCLHPMANIWETVLAGYLNLGQSCLITTVLAKFNFTIFFFFGGSLGQLDLEMYQALF